MLVSFLEGKTPLTQPDPRGLLLTMVSKAFGHCSRATSIISDSDSAIEAFWRTAPDQED